MPEKPHGYSSSLISICLVAAIIVVYLPVYSYDFIRYDDTDYVTDNINVQTGLNWKNVRWAFTTGHASNWHPLTWLSHILDWELFGDWAGGHHLVNVLFHILNTLILFYVLKIMTKSLWPSAFVAAAFAIHPLHVESVAWIAERKDVLSTFFWFLTMWAYVQYVAGTATAKRTPTARLRNASDGQAGVGAKQNEPRQGSPSQGYGRINVGGAKRYYLLAIVFFVLGLMSKPMLVTLPFVLLLLDYWPLERKFSKTLIIEKIPFFLCSFASSIITFIVQKKGGAMSDFEFYGPAIRIGNAIVSYIMYIVKMFWPSRLAVLYPHPSSSLPISKVIICAFLLVLITAGVIYFGRRYKFLAVGWLWYVGTLIPVIGLVQVGSQAMADRYTYITLTGLFIIIGWGAKEIIHNKNIILMWLAVIVLLASAITARRQLRYWKNSLTLFEHTLQVTGDNFYTLVNYATYLSELDRLDRAVKYFNEALKIKPDSAEVHNNLGSALLKIGRTQQGVEHFKLAIKYKPDLSQAYCNLADALKNQGRYKEAVSYYQQAIKTKPNCVSAWLNLAITFNEMKDFDRAIEYFNKVLEIDRNNVFARGHLGLTLAAMGKTDEALREIRFVLSVRPDDVEMYRNLGILLEKKDDITGAIKAYRTAVQINPNDANARRLLEAALKKNESN
ncbi:MAG: hypothetical protein CVV39_06855 [Planctomycetes bacterium HGW-Planctomycetes-1]|nr:MAG: hypothetical protein CVV39_06855 [Planctomycetes bacterium HGW-Planctomycetes-1]